MGPWILILVREAKVASGTGIRSGTGRSPAEALQDITLAEDSYESSIS